MCWGGELSPSRFNHRQTEHWSLICGNLDLIMLVAVLRIQLLIKKSRLFLSVLAFYEQLSKMCLESNRLHVIILTNKCPQITIHLLLLDAYDCITYSVDQIAWDLKPAAYNYCIIIIIIVFSQLSPPTTRGDKDSTRQANAIASAATAIAQHFL